MKIIKEYLDSLFLNVPITLETQKAKEDLLAIMEDHYYELIAEGKSEHEAIGAVISEFGSIDELLAALELEDVEDLDETHAPDEITLDDAFDYWAVTRSFAFELSLGILLLCCSVGSAFLFNGEFLGMMALFSFFLCGASGIGFIISGGVKYGKEKKKLEDRPLQKDVIQEATEQGMLYEKSFRTGLTLGIGGCVLAIPLCIFLASFFYAPRLAGMMFMLTAGMGVFLILYSSIIRHGFTKLSKQRYFISDQDNPGPRAIQDVYGNAAPFVIALKKFYWPIVFIFYFLWSTHTQTWGRSWIIFVFAGIVDTAINEALKQKK